MKIKFVAGVTPIVSDLDKNVAFFRDGLDLPVRADADHPDYFATNDLEGLKHFGLWKLADAAEACFGTREWPAEVPVPQATIEFEVDDVAASAAEMEQRGHTLLHGAVTYPWGQTVAHVLSPDGLLIGLSNTPWMQ
jgi:catechol 2,3-dioxygenase-like lactoylglutathione lyase family enzyme